MEPDEARIYSAAHMMVASLAGNFAHVTCKVFFLLEARRLGFLIFFVYILAIVFILSCFFLCIYMQEPLRTSISGHLRNSLQGLNIKNEALEQIVQVVTNDNLDMGCAAIEQAATGKVCAKKNYIKIYVPAFKLINLEITRIDLEWIASTLLDETTLFALLYN